MSIEHASHRKSSIPAILFLSAGAISFAASAGSAHIASQEVDQANKLFQAHKTVEAQALVDVSHHKHGNSELYLAMGGLDLAAAALLIASQNRKQ